MINIGNNRKIHEIAKKYLRKIKSKKRHKGNNLVRSYYIKHIDEIILAKPDEFEGIIKRFDRLFKFRNSESFDDFKSYMENQYKSMGDEYGEWLANALNIRVCPYCNRQYTFTLNSKWNIIQGIKTRPEFEHFHNKSTYPYLALSFYNLVPSCHTCNHVKGVKSIKIHPYIAGFSCKFQIEDKAKIAIEKNNLLLLKEKQLRIELNCTSDERTNIDAFGLRELYNQHKDYVKEIMDKTQAYDSHAREALVNSFQGAGYSPEEVRRFVWGKYLEDAEHEKRPLSKLTKDILDQLNIH